MASTVYVNGRATPIPGAYTEIDVSGLVRVGLGATGVVALLGEAEGGSPYGGSTPIHKISNPGKIGRTFRDGDLPEGGQMLFDPSRDPDIPGGAQEVFFVKVNPATQSTVTLLDSGAGDALDITSVDYGLFTTQIHVDIADGTTKGKSITVTLDDLVETFDNVGGDAAFTALYTPGVNGATTMLMALDNTTGVTATFTRAESGLDGDISAVAEVGEAVSVHSTDAGDAMTITIYGMDNAGTPAPQTETLTLDGTTVVVGTATWSKIFGAILSEAADGTVTVESNPTVATDILSFAPATVVLGVALADFMVVDAGTALSYVSSGASTKDVAVFGLSATGAPVAEAVTLTGTTPVAGAAAAIREITVIALGDMEAAQTLTISGTAINLPLATYESVKKVADFINALDSTTAAQGWDVTQAPSSSNLLIASLDNQAATTTLSTLSFYGDNAYVAQALTDGSSLVNAAVSTGSTAPPANTTSTVYLSGGIEGATAFADWQAALDLLRAEQVNTIVVLTSDAAVHAAAIAHCAYMAGVGRKERDCILGAAADQTLTQLQAQAQTLNTRHARYCHQEVQRYNRAGTLEWFPPYFTACLAAGAQAGSPAGEPLTSKYFNVIDVRGDDATYTTVDDAASLIQSGLWTLEQVPNIGFRNLRNVTTHLIDNNNAYVEASMNEAINVTAFNLRAVLEDAIGRKGFQGTVNQIASLARKTLNVLVDEEVLAQWRNLVIELDGDTMDVDVEVAPVSPINFVKTTLHIVSASFAAAA